MSSNNRVVVGLSGGVDSAVTAHLLKQQGWDVVGIFMKNWEDDDDSEYCSSNQDFIDAARVQGMGPWRIMFTEILPNVASTIMVFLPLILADSILLEAYLSFLGAGVQAPNASWGTLISDGLSYIHTTPTYSLIPGAMLVLTVLSVNVVGDGVRDALDPRAQVRVRN